MPAEGPQPDMELTSPLILTQYENSGQLNYAETIKGESAATGVVVTASA